MHNHSSLWPILYLLALHPLYIRSERQTDAASGAATCS